MDLKNLPSRYTQVSDEMEGSKEASDLIKASDDAFKGGKPIPDKDIKELTSRPGFLTWKNGDKPWFNLPGSAKITGKTFDLDNALQKKLASGSQRQGRPTKEFPNIKPLVVQASPEMAKKVEKAKDEDDKDEKSELGQLDAASTKQWLKLAGVFGLGCAVGYWLARR